MSAWATRLAQLKQTDSQSPVSSTKRETPSPVPVPADAVPVVAENFNAEEVLEYLHRNFQKQLANVNTQDDDARVYKLLESASQWKTKPVAQKKGTASRNSRKSDSKGSGFDLLYELNRSQNQKSQ